MGVRVPLLALEKPLETGNRAGLLLCSDLVTAVRVVLRETAVGLPDTVTAEVVREHAQKPGPLKELLRYFVSEENFALRDALGTAVKF